MRVEDVDIVEPQPLQALIDRSNQVLLRGADAVRPRPHLISCLGRDYELIAQTPEVLAKDRADDLFWTSIGRSIHIGQIEVRHAPIECPSQNGAARLERVHAAKILPGAERY